MCFLLPALPINTGGLGGGNVWKQIPSFYLRTTLIIKIRNQNQKGLLLMLGANLFGFD